MEFSVKSTVSWVSLDVESDLAWFLKAKQTGWYMWAAPDCIAAPDYGHLNIIVCNDITKQDIIARIKKEKFRVDVSKEDAYEPIYHELDIDYIELNASSLNNNSNFEVKKDGCLLFISDYSEFISKYSIDEQRRIMGRLIARSCTGIVPIFFTSKKVDEWYGNSACYYFIRKSVLNVYEVE